MKNYKTELKEVSIIEKVYCNCCGKEIIKQDLKQDLLQDYLTIEKTWGYFSPFDGEHHSFDLCSDCYKQFTSSFKIPIDITDVEI